MPRAFLLALSLALLAASSAEASTVRFTAPGSTRKANPCTRATPCQLEWAVTHSGKGDTVRLRRGTYFWPGSRNQSLALPGGVTLRGVVGPKRPLIEQSAAYPSYNGPLLDVGVGATVRDVAIDQSVGGAGAITLPQDSIAERVVLTGTNGMYFLADTGPAGALRDSLVVATNGAAIDAQGKATYHVENVTAIAHGANGDAVRVNGFVDQPATLQAVNVIARGDRYDVAAESYSSPAKAFLRHSNFRGGSHVHVTPNASIGATNQQTTDPLFVSPFDFHEKKGSVTIDFGTAKGLTGKRDLDGLPRTIGSHPDVGAYEYLPPFLGVSIGKKATVGADGRAAVRLGCRAKTVGRCKGKLRLARSSDNKTLGTTKFSLRRGKSRVVKVPLTKGAQTALASGKTLNATATAAAHDGVGQSATTKRALQLKR